MAKRKAEAPQEFDFGSWYRDHEPRYRRLAEAVRGIIEGLLLRADVPFLSVTCRTKDPESAHAKIQRKGYDDPPEQVHDYAGVRIITFIEADALRAAAVVAEAFHVHPDKTPDKIEDLGVDRIGYRSTHLVCDLGASRLKLPEFQDIGALVFEVQVRTVLQHAWAEFEHDRNYKFAGVLPAELRRRLFLAAGLLEIADQEFDRLASDISLYAKNVGAEAKRGELQIDLNSTSILEFIKLKFPELGEVRPARSEILALVISELADFGAKTLADLDRLLTPEFKAVWDRHARDTSTVAGFIRTAMIFADADRYFGKAWKHHWVRPSPAMAAMITERFGDDAQRILSRLNPR